MPAISALTIRVCRQGITTESHVFDTDRTVTVGKEAQCDLVLSDRGVSRTHCKFAFIYSTWTVCDLQSTNGLTINGKLVEAVKEDGSSKPIALRSGDEVGVGMVLLKVEFHNTEEGTVDATEVLTRAAVESLLGQTAKSVRVQPENRSPAESPLQHSQTLVVQRDSVKKLLAQAPSVDRFPKMQSNTVANPFRERFQSRSDHPRGASEFKTLPCDFHEFSLRKRIGAGEMGEVFLATSSKTSETACAIKFLKTHAGQSSPERLRFIQELQIAIKLKHSSLVECFEYGKHNEQVFLVTAYCNGGNLGALLKRTGKLPLRRALRLMYRLLAGVCEAHNQGIVHRNLKPSNVLLHRELDGRYFPKVSDLGLANCFRDVGESGATLREPIGSSWGYMPKELILDFRGALPQSDVWSLGAILYECLTNRLPRAVDIGTDPIREILESKGVPMEPLQKELPSTLTDFLATTLAIDVKSRFRDAGEMQAELQKVAGRLGVEL